MSHLSQEWSLETERQQLAIASIFNNEYFCLCFYCLPSASPLPVLQLYLPRFNHTLDIWTQASSKYDSVPGRKVAEHDLKEERVLAVQPAMLYVGQRMELPIVLFDEKCTQ